MIRIYLLLTFSLVAFGCLSAQDDGFRVLLTNTSVPIKVDTFVFAKTGHLREYRKAFSKPRRGKKSETGLQRNILKRNDLAEGPVLRIDSSFVEWADGRLTFLIAEVTALANDELTITQRSIQRIRSQKTYLLDDKGRPYRLTVLKTSAGKDGQLVESTVTYAYDWHDDGKVSVVDANDAKRKYACKFYGDKGNFHVDDFTGNQPDRTHYRFNKAEQLRTIVLGGGDRQNVISYHNGGLTSGLNSMSTSPKASVNSSSLKWRVKKKDLPGGLSREGAELASAGIIEQTVLRRSSYRLLFPELLPHVTGGSSR